MAGIGDLNFDPAQNYLAGANGPNDDSSPAGLRWRSRAARLASDGSNDLDAKFGRPPGTATNQAIGDSQSGGDAGQTFSSRSGAQQPFQNTPEQQSYIDAKQAAGPAARATTDQTIGAGLSDAAGEAGAAPGIGSRMWQGIGARAGEAVGSKFSPATRIVARAVGRPGLGIGGALIRNAGPIGDVAYEGIQAAPTLIDPRASGYDKAAAVAKGIGRGFSTMAGAGIGAAAGSIVPVVGTAIGGIAGGIAGFFGGDKAIQWGRKMLDAQPYEAPSFIDQGIDAGRAARAASTDPKTVPQPTGAGQPIPRGQATPSAPDVPAPAELSSQTIYRNGNSFSDRPGAGYTAYTPAGGGIAGSSNPSQLDTDATRQRILSAGRLADQQIAQGAQDENEERARQQAQMADSINGANAYDQRQAAENRARSGQVALHVAQWAGDGRDQINAIRGQLARDQQQQQDGLVPNSSPTPEQEIAMGGAQQRQQLEADAANRAGDQQQQQGIAQGIELGQKQQLQSIFQRLNDPKTPPDQRRALQEQALVMQGKDPRESNVKGGDVKQTDAMGNTTSTPVWYDQNSGQVINPFHAVVGQTAQQQAPAEGSIVYRGGKPYKVVNGQPVAMNGSGIGDNLPSRVATAVPTADQFLTAARVDPRNKGKSDEQLKAYYQQKYGK